jgi:hypothetical protein
MEIGRRHRHGLQKPVLYPPHALENPPPFGTRSLEVAFALLVASKDQRTHRQRDGCETTAACSTISCRVFTKRRKGEEEKRRRGEKEKRRPG